MTPISADNSRWRQHCTNTGRTISTNYRTCRQLDFFNRILGRCFLQSVGRVAEYPLPVCRFSHFAPWFEPPGTTADRFHHNKTLQNLSFYHCFFTVTHSLDIRKTGAVDLCSSGFAFYAAFSIDIIDFEQPLFMDWGKFP